MFSNISDKNDIIDIIIENRRKLFKFKKKDKIVGQVFKTFSCRTYSKNHISLRPI